MFDGLLVMLRRWARSLEELLGTQRLQPQLRLAVAAALLASLWPIFERGLQAGPLPWSRVDPALALAWAVGAPCALGAAWQAKFHRLVALMLAGGAGLVVCLTFVWMSAPDLALTQLWSRSSPRCSCCSDCAGCPSAFHSRGPGPARAALPRRVRDLALAVAAGSVLAALSYAVMTRPLPETISRYFVEQAYPRGGGTNVVNVILVDFRGFDTLVEITVLAVVAIAVYALLRRFRPARESMQSRASRRRRAAPSAPRICWSRR